MKIVHICMAQYSDGWTYQENLLTKYHKILGHEVVLITSMYCYKEGNLVEDTKSSFIDVNGVRIIRLKRESNGFFKKMPTYDGFYKTLLEEKPDIIFSHGCQYRDMSSLVKYMKKYPCTKLFVDNHADFSNSAISFLSRVILHKIIWRFYTKKLLPYVEVFWGVLPARVGFLSDVYDLPKEKCKLLVMGADDEMIEKSREANMRSIIRKQYAIENTDFLVVTGGKIDSAKLQTELLMKAILTMNKPNVKLLIFGSIEETIRDRIMSLVDGERIIYAGWISPEQSYGYFESADLVVFPGRHSVFWEQVAGQGKPMVCKSWPGTRHVDVGGNVAFIEEDGVNSIKEVLDRIIDHPEIYSNMLQIATEKATKEFSYKEIAKRSIEIVN